MKKYKLNELDLSEKGGTCCHECPLQDNDIGGCSAMGARANSHLDVRAKCSTHRAKLRKDSNLALYYKRLSCIVGVVALGLMLKLFVTSQQSPIEGATQLLLMCCSSLSLVVSLFGKKLDEIGK